MSVPRRRAYNDHDHSAHTSSSDSSSSPGPPISSFPTERFRGFAARSRLPLLAQSSHSRRRSQYFRWAKSRRGYAARRSLLSCSTETGSKSYPFGSKRTGEKGAERTPRAAHSRLLPRLFARRKRRDPCRASLWGTPVPAWTWAFQTGEKSTKIRSARNGTNEG